MQNLGVFGKPCSRHPPNLVTGICTHPDCTNRVLCHECQTSHDIKHKSSFKSVLEILKMDIESEFTELKRISEEVKSSLDKEVQKVDQYIEKIRIKIENELSEFRANTIKKIFANQQNATSYIVSNETLDLLKNDYLRRKAEAFNYKGFENEGFHKLRQEFAQVYSDRKSVV